MSFIYLIIDGFPSFTSIPNEYSSIITGSLSTALAFATSGIFSNYIAGLLMWIIDPFDIGDIVKFKGQKGLVKSITLTKVILETFDRIIIEISNSELVSSIILNYSIKLRRKKNYTQFKKLIRSPQEIGNARLDIDVYNEEKRKESEEELNQFHEKVMKNDNNVVHSFNFKMHVPYHQFRIKVAEIEKICRKYKDVFGMKPSFHIIDFGNQIVLKFRILTLSETSLLMYQSKMVEELYKIILKH
ncbi:MAG: mechanosensitive ion channel domain-containing protein [Promethearchaeota archaeon]